MNVRIAGDLSGLPEVVYGHRSPQWWGLMGFVAIEGTIFALCIAAYFYVRLHSPAWPPEGVFEPSLYAGTINTVLIVLAAVPMFLIERHALRGNRAHVLMHTLIFLILCAGILAVRAYEFPAFHVKWDSNTYGSIVWITLFFHSLHLLTTFFEAAVLGAYVAFRELDDKRALDLQLNTFYWYFLVISWGVIYTILYFGPRMLNSP